MTKDQAWTEIIGHLLTAKALAPDSPEARFHAAMVKASDARLSAIRARDDGWTATAAEYDAIADSHEREARALFPLKQAAE